jgi:hypothetical protein
MKKIFPVFLLLLIFVTASAQKTVYDENADLRNAKGFHAIEVSGGITLYLSAGDEAVAVSASETKYRDKIITTIENGVLKINYPWEKGLLGGAKSLKAYVSYKALDAITASGGSNIITAETLTLPALKVEVSGGSDFEGSVDIADLQVRQSGGSDVKISGRAGKLWVDASGGSDFKGYSLSAETCTLSASGASDINITAFKALSAEATGASDIKWKGTAEVKSARASGSSSIKKS